MVQTIQQVNENKVTLAEARRMSILHEGQVYNYFDEGLTRFVFVNEDRTKVIKLEKGEDHVQWNQEEYTIYQKASEKQKNHMAETRLVDGFIEQEYCEPQKFSGRKLTIPQMIFANSCRGEVGWTKDGRLVCFDLDEFREY